MNRFLRYSVLVAAGAAAIATAPLQARDVNGWHVAPSKQGACMMTATFDDRSDAGVSLALVWDKPRQQLGFLAAGKHWNEALRSEGGQPSLHMSFDGDVTYRNWTYEDAHFDKLGGGIETVMGIWGDEHREFLAEAVTRSNRVAIRVGEADMGSFDISGAEAAYRELLRCGDRG